MFNRLTVFSQDSLDKPAPERNKSVINFIYSMARCGTDFTQDISQKPKTRWFAEKTQLTTVF